MSRSRPKARSKIEKPADTVDTAGNNQPELAALNASDVYSPKYANTARSLRALGASEGELCDAFGVSAETLALWQIQDAEFAKACSANDPAWVNRLKEVVFQQALGRKFTEQTIVEQGGKRKVMKVQKEVPPNLDAAKFLLTNLDPENWQLKPEPVAAVEKEGEFAILLRQINESRHAHIGPVAMHPGEVKSGGLLEHYGGVLPECAKGWKRNPLYNPKLLTDKKAPLTEE
ncbi:MAG: hypothetical protein KIT48_09060 [Pseudolabrys sp.]|nr:hypothetical protein [Pseudolabrys sp.]